MGLLQLTKKRPHVEKIEQILEVGKINPEEIG